MNHLLKIGIAVFLFCTISLFCACGKASYADASFAYTSSAADSYSTNRIASRARTPGLAYDDASWEATGFSPMGAAGVEGATPPAYRDTSNLAGNNPSGDQQYAPAPGENTVQTRKLVKTASIILRVENPEDTEKPLTELMEKYNAWPASTGIYENSRSYSIRVPSAFYDVMLSELTAMGKTIRRSENAEDVTLRYYDLESRLATKRELLKTYQSYLGKASNIDEIMTVESRIADLQQDIERTGTQFRNLVGQIDYSTISMEILGPVGSSSYSEPTFGEKLKDLFSSFGGVASSALVIITGIIIYGVPLILIIIFLFWVLFGRIGILKKLLLLAAGKGSPGMFKLPGWKKTQKENQ